MNEETSSLKTNIHNAEEWVSMARKFGVDCAAIQHDAALSLEQRFEKQLLLAKEIVEKIEADSHLKPEEKQQMLASVKNYTDEWKLMNEILFSKESNLTKEPV